MCGFGGTEPIIVEYWSTSFSLLWSPEDPLFKAIQINDCLKAMPDAKYINRLHLFKVEDFNDLRPLLPPLEAGDEQDEIELKINNIFGAI